MRVSVCVDLCAVPLNLAFPPQIQECFERIDVMGDGFITWVRGQEGEGGRKVGEKGKKI